MCVLAIPSSFWSTRSTLLISLNSLLTALAREINLVNRRRTRNTISVVFAALFLFILLNNFLGLLPYVFTASRHPAFTFVLAISSWAGYMLYSSLKNFSKFLAHLAPAGTPKPLIPFIVIIELIRSFIRPITLGVRLAANIVAGHLILVLARRPMPGLSFRLIRICFGALILLIGLELGVSFIQSYVFIRLSSLYVREVQAENLS